MYEIEQEEYVLARKIHQRKSTKDKRAQFAFEQISRRVCTRMRAQTTEITLRPTDDNNNCKVH